MKSKNSYKNWKNFTREQLKKFTGTLPKVDLNVDNFELWMTVMSAVEQMEQIRSWIVGIRAFIPHEKQKKNFWLLDKKMPFFEILHVNYLQIYCKLVSKHIPFF